MVGSESSGQPPDRPDAGFVVTNDLRDDPTEAIALLAVSQPLDSPEIASPTISLSLELLAGTSPLVGASARASSSPSSTAELEPPAVSSPDDQLAMDPQR
jgi:hypothetical protein